MIDVREALSVDMEQAKALFNSFIEESYAAGGPIYPSARTFGAISGLIEVIHSWKPYGTVSVAAEGTSLVGVLLWGNPAVDDGLQFREGRVAMGYGTYVKPEFRGKGISSLLRAFATARLIDRGYSAVVGAATGKEPALESMENFGFEEYDKSYIKRFY